MTLTTVSDLPAECAALRANQVFDRKTCLLEVYRARKEGRQLSGVYGHLLNCASCRTWIRDQIPEPYYVRAMESADYCCMSMYMAVVETRPGREFRPGMVERIRFSLWRGEDPQWLMGTGTAGIRHCPWCGKSLPDAPFSDLTVTRDTPA